ncbi:hypothetical protein D3C80_1748240 [compost metagenome]
MFRKLELFDGIRDGIWIWPLFHFALYYVIPTFIDADSRGSQKPTNLLWLPPVMQEVFEPKVM